ncbi:hypothetical protein OKW96_16585 [Sphingobacterium sp. KU25419]|nr:hypothetical protein OKW96_16585 [Sphingobacterium sp. KU25419]
MVGQSSDYTMSSVGDVIEIVPGAESIYRFKVKMQRTVGGNIHTVYCEGYTDYPIGSGEMIQNVVLFDHQNNQVCADTVNCERQVLLSAVQQGKLLHGRYIDSIKQSHFLAMRRHFPTNTTDSLWLSTHKQQYQYTLYYYDLAGNLVRTVPPAGVDTLSPSVIPYVDEHRTNGGLGYKPNHTKVSLYQYNGLDQLVMQWTPDADTTKFFYDKSSRVVFSQNAKQKAQSKYSYTLYDLQGRISETGAIGFLPSDYVIFGVQQDHPALVKIAEAVEHSFIADQVRSKPREDVVATFYDNALINLGTNAGLTAQENLRKRVSSILYAPQLAMQQSSESYYAYASHFSYDAMGNVSTLTQDNPYMDYLGQRFKRIDYDYDLLSGKVNMVSYNRGRPDQFYQKYEYDADNRLEIAMSSKDGLIWDRDASYRYYKHGPLAQMDLGELKVQSIQYAYTIQGWLKAINGDILRPEDDMGEDGLNGGLYPKDVFAHSLDYHLGDYKQIGNRRATYTDSINPLSRSLFNGNIARQTTGMHTIDNLQRTYTYDQLHRLKQGDYASVSNDLYRTVTTMATTYKNAYSYDMDGNIKTLIRKNAAGTDIDNLTYHYPDPLKNKLGYVTDAAANSVGSDLPTGQISDNYHYDEIGNLVSDQQGQLENISWNLYGKVEQIETGTDNLLIHYDYDGAGNRVRKDVFVKEGSDTIRRSDVYVRDASGNILAVYKGVSKVNDVLTIEWLNDHIQTQHGAWQTPNNTGLSPFLNAQFAHNGQFSTGLVQAAINISSVWSNNQSSSLTLGQYLQLSDGIYAQALNESIGDYFAPMVSADPGIMMATFSSNGDNSGFRNIFRSLAEDSRQSFPTIMHLSKYTPDISIAILDYIGLPSSGLSDVDRANQISGYALSGGAPLVWEGFLESAKNFSADEFYKNLASDPNIINKSWLLSNPGLADELRNNINLYAPRDAASGFFQGYLETLNPNWLKDHSSLDERLHVVYQNDRDGFMVSYLNNIGVASVNTVLSNIPQLSVYGYLQQINIGVLTGTLNPTYNPPQVNTPNPSNIAADTLFLSEHHLYGSSRLGIKTYNKDDYRVVYIGDDGVTQAHLSDSTLNIRRPWLSGGFQDWIKHDRVSPYSGNVFNLSLDTFREVRNLGSKQYELTDHLGNMLATVMDRKSGYGALSGLYAGYYANLANVSDHFPGGFVMSERTKEFENYSFGYNTQMKSDEVYGKGNLSTAKFWEMDTRILRRWNLDPVDQISISNYAVNGLNPILYSDPAGDLFGIKGFGSTSEQRQAAKSFAKENNGQVKNLLRGSIHVDYAGGTENNIVLNGIAVIRPATRSQYFYSDGRMESPNGDIMQHVPNAMDKWGSSESWYGRATYSFTDAFYVTGQNLFVKNFRSDDLSFHLDGQVTTTDDNIDAFISVGTTFVPIGGASAAVSTKVIGSAQSTGTIGHAFFSKAIALRYAVDPRVSKVTLDLGYKRLLGGGNFRYGPRPDVGVLFHSGRVKVSKLHQKQIIC